MSWLYVVSSTQWDQPEPAHEVYLVDQEEVVRFDAALYRHQDRMVELGYRVSTTAVDLVNPKNPLNPYIQTAHDLYQEMADFIWETRNVDDSLEDLQEEEPVAVREALARVCAEERDGG